MRQRYVAVRTVATPSTPVEVDRPRPADLAGAATLAWAESRAWPVLIICETDDRIVYANDAAAVLAGRARTDIAGSSLGSIGIPARRESAVTSGWRWDVGGPAGSGATFTVEASSFTAGLSYRVEEYRPDAGGVCTDLATLLRSRIDDLDAAQQQLTDAWRHHTGGRAEERRRLAVALHDDTVQRLSAAAWQIDGIAADCPPPLAAQLAGVRAALTDTVSGVREMIAQLYPTLLTAHGLAEAVRRRAALIFEDTSCRWDVTTTGPIEKVPQTTAAILYRAASQALRNVLLHAHAESCRVTIDVGDDTVQLTIVDDGVGFAPAAAAVLRSAGHIGLESVQDSLLQAGGSLVVANRRDGQGTVFDAALPLPLTP